MEYEVVYVAHVEADNRDLALKLASTWKPKGVEILEISEVGEEGK